MTEKELYFPSRILLSEGDVRAADRLLIPIPLQSLTGSHPARPWAELRGKCVLLFDFGQELCGGIRLLCHALSGVQKNTVFARLRLGESAAECCAELGERGACNDYTPRDFSVPILPASSVLWGDSGFRFARLDIDLPKGAVLNLLAVAAEGRRLSLPVQYVCGDKDPLLLDIYRTARRTVDLCAATGFVWDGIKRDHLVWGGDLHPAMLALTALYGRTDEVEASICFLKDTTPANEWVCGILTYSAWWLIILADYYRETGCTEFAVPLIPYADGIISRLLSVVSEDGEIMENGDFSRFVDWPTKGTTDEDVGARAILLCAAKRIATFFSSLAYPARGAILLADRLAKKPLAVSCSMQAVGLKYMATGSLDLSDVAILCEKGARGMSTFMSYYILTAYARYLGKEAAISVMKEYYGAMLSRGATTFFEDFDLAWLEGSSRIDELPKKGELDLHGDFGERQSGFRHSLCHGWSAGILRFMKDLAL